MSYFDAQGYEAGKAYSCRSNQFLRLVMSYDSEFNSGIVCDLIKNKNSCGIKSMNYSTLG